MYVTLAERGAGSGGEFTKKRHPGRSSRCTLGTSLRLAVTAHRRNRYEQAPLEWQQARCPIIPTPARARDPEYPIEVRHFPHWNAHSLFFWDPVGNLLEHIARHDLDNSREGDFGTGDILNISEIAFVVDDQQQMARAMNRELGLDVYPKTTSSWWAMGDENGLMLAIPKRIWGENLPDPKRFGVHRTEATIRGTRDGLFGYEDLPYSITMKKRTADE